MRKTKIVATLGPATDRADTIEKLIEAGVDVFRLNASHGAREEHGRRIERVRAAAGASRRSPAILLDLQGPKIRLGVFEGGGADLASGSRFRITTESVAGTAAAASTSYAGLPADVRPGDRVLLADGEIELRALASDGKAVDFEVVSGGRISDRKGIALPGTDVSLPSLTPKDEEDLAFGLSAGVDLLALSFVRRAEDIRRLRERAGGLPIVAKIEKPQGWQHIDEILEVSDGVMVARGDLGVEIALEKVPAIQKSIIRRARRRGRFVITATQMLESMIEHPTPTRAEVSDVANAIYDGTDAVMLSAESSVGKYPLEAVRYMARIAEESDGSLAARGYQEPPHRSPPSRAEIVADAAHHAARDAGAKAIVVFTSTGSSARLVSRYRPPVPIYAITPDERVARQLAVNYGVSPLLAGEAGSTDDMLVLMEQMLVDRGLLKPGDDVVFVAGQPVGRPGATNMLKLHRIGEK
jgi:pyruvate kinase